MRAGQLDQRIIIEQNTGSSIDAVGDPTDVWVTFKTVWANIATQTGNEFIRAKEANSELTHLITTRFIAGVTSKMRINDGGAIYNILSVFDPKRTKESLKLMCNEQL